MQTQVPAFIPCFNNRTYAEHMVRQLSRLGFSRIVLLDNASTAPDMRAWLGSSACTAEIIQLDRNLGPWHLVKDPTALALLPRHFCLTDPDLEFNRDLPEDFLSRLASVITRESVGKAGFALDIADRAALRDDLFVYGDQRMRIWEWEEKFWRRPLAPLDSGDPVYAAAIDTTFALYDLDRYRPDDFYSAVRVAGRFTARHLPWYRQGMLPDAEAAEYARTQAFSNYF